MKEQSSGTRVIERVLDIFECFTGSENELNLVELSQRTQLSTSTTYRIIKDLENRHYLSRNEISKRYYLGPKIAFLGTLCVNALNSELRVKCLPFLMSLQEKYNETVSVFVQDDDKRICIERVESTQMLRRVLKIGERLPLKFGSPGMLILAYLPEDEQRRFLEDEYETNIDTLKEIREKELTISDSLSEFGLSSISTPIFNASGKMVAALSLSGPSTRLSKKTLKEMIADLKKVGEELSREMGYFK